MLMLCRLFLTLLHDTKLHIRHLQKSNKNIRFDWEYNNNNNEYISAQSTSGIIAFRMFGYDWNQTSIEHIFRIYMSTVNSEHCLKNTSNTGNNTNYSINRSFFVVAEQLTGA